MELATYLTEDVVCAPPGAVSVHDVASLLRRRYVIITGGRCGSCPILTFPDPAAVASTSSVDSGGSGDVGASSSAAAVVEPVEPCWVSDDEYRQLVIYLTSIPVLEEADRGFVLVIDRRQDRWSSVKAALLHIASFFPGLIGVCYVVRPCGFFQGTWADLSYKFSRDEFKFKVVICGSLGELHSYVDPDQLTADLGGTIPHQHEHWIQQRMDLEKFSLQSEEVSASLEQFIAQLQHTELPPDVATLENILKSQTQTYSRLKCDLLGIAEYGEIKLSNIRRSAVEASNNISYNPDKLINVTAIERLLVQLEETARRFENFWTRYEDRLYRWLQIRKFDHNFKDCQTELEHLLKKLTEMSDVGESVEHVDFLIADLGALEKHFSTELEHLLKKLTEMSDVGESVEHVDFLIADLGALEKHFSDIRQRSLEVQGFGRGVHADAVSACGVLAAGGGVRLGGAAAVGAAAGGAAAGDAGTVLVRCGELQRAVDAARERLDHRTQLLRKCRHLHLRVNQASSWCGLGVELLSSQPMDRLSTDPVTAERCLRQLEHFLSTSSEFRLDHRGAGPPAGACDLYESFHDVTAPETRGLVQQMVQRLEDVQTMCDRRCAHLRRIVSRQEQRPVLSVLPAPAVPLDKVKLRSRPARTNASQQRDGDASGEGCQIEESESRDPVHLAAKRKHILNELIETERNYVTELYEIIKGYMDEISNVELSPLLPEDLSDKADLLFGNLEELHRFHSVVFLGELENCGIEPELIGNCFVERKEVFHKLYTEYCMNKPASEELRQRVGDANPFFVECQRRLQHRLPLGAYLLKPVQRITKYQLLLKDLLRYSEDEVCRQQLQVAVCCMLDTLKCVNDSMHQIAISGFPGNLLDLGRLLLQSSHLVWIDNKKDKLKDLRNKPRRRHVFLYEKMILFCKKKEGIKPRYTFKNCLKMSQVGLTEMVKGDCRKLELWLPGRSEVHTILASSPENKDLWISEIKQVLMEQLKFLKGQNLKQYRIKERSDSLGSTASPSVQRPMRHAASWENAAPSSPDSFSGSSSTARSKSITSATTAPGSRLSPQNSLGAYNPEDIFSSDYSSDDETTYREQERYNRHSRFVALSDYEAVGVSEINLVEGESVLLLKVGCAGWWYVRTPGGGMEGWAPASYLQRLNTRHSCGSPSASSAESGCAENASTRATASRNSIASNLSVPSEVEEDVS